MVRIFLFERSLDEKYLPIVFSKIVHHRIMCRPMMVDVFGVVLRVLYPIQQQMNVFVKKDIIKLALTHLDEEYVKVRISCIFSVAFIFIRYFSSF
jgi:hypothetical protein